MATIQPSTGSKRKEVSLDTEHRGFPNISQASVPVKRTKLETPGFICFRLEGTSNVPKRTPNGPKRRQEIKEMRHLQACLRCRLLKKAVGSSVILRAKHAS